ncbi:MAG: anthranilate phosphoribosyltransferase [Alphaproteobacteria bacterium]|nr:anthranilate phosphoribosyltransferase [Alphaproteobacteria bacterium]
MDVAALTDAGRAPLSRADTETLFHAIFRGELNDEQIVAYLSATADRKPTVDELVGAVRAMRAHMRAVAAPPDAIDLCGTGGDGLGTLNISTAVSFVVAAAGVPVAKHGNRSATSRSGAADVLEALGVKVGLEPDRAARVLRETGIVFLFAPNHHPAMKYVAAARKAIGRRTIFNLLGPLANPAQVKRQLIGVFSGDWLEPYAQALHLLGSSRAVIVHGRDGLDEVSISETTQMAMLDKANVTTGEITPEQAGLGRSPLAGIVGGDAAHNAAALRRLFDGEPGPYRDIVCLNAAAALMVADAACDIKAGVDIAAGALSSGAARAKLYQLIDASNL